MPGAAPHALVTGEEKVVLVQSRGSVELRRVVGFNAADEIEKLDQKNQGRSLVRNMRVCAPSWFSSFTKRPHSLGHYHERKDKTGTRVLGGRRVIVAVGAGAPKLTQRRNPRHPSQGCTSRRRS